MPAYAAFLVSVFFLGFGFFLFALVFREPRLEDFLRHGHVVNFVVVPVAHEDSGHVQILPSQIFALSGFDVEKRTAQVNAASFGITNTTTSAKTHRTQCPLCVNLGPSLLAKLASDPDPVPAGRCS
jgi:hypothetical protein